ncbi:hypothetical protein D9619_000525 [Psilocybe cf. subviscida]|uniref:PEBP-like protein n=1 Tax=Psilocybe cf. subviscida TaxID=2480587 RepID=A0A8H5BHA1_9AGAR|nr:hypothetical protein D9619_000525 [Psilocybe cf. subviscida]
MLSALVAALSIAHICLAQTPSDGGVANVTTAFSKAKIVPNVISSFSPMEALDVTFTDSVTMESIALITGSLLTMEQTANQPQFTLDSSNSTSTDMSNVTNWVIVMFDPDAPTPQMPNVSEFLHFIGGDFSFDSSGALSNTSAALVEYFSPAPPISSDPHRYVLLVYNQPDDFDMTGPMIANSSSPRTNFSVTNFAQMANLGSPIAGNFFLVGPDASSSNSSASSTANGTSATASDQTAQPTTGALTSGLPTLTPIPTASAPPTSATTPTSGAILNKLNIAVSSMTAAVALAVYYL